MSRRVTGLLTAVACGLAFAAVAAATSAGTAVAAPPTGCGFHNLGTLPLTGATTAGTAMDRTHPDGPRIYSVTSSAGQAVLGARDALTGALIDEVTMPGAFGSWAVAVAPDHRVYLGSYSAGRLYRFDPDTSVVTDLGVAVPGETFIWTVAVAPAGTVYGGTSHTGHLFRHDPVTGVTTDLGIPVPGEQFVRDLAIGPDGTIYAGIGAVTMKVAVLSPDGTVRRVIDPPAGVGETGYAYDVDVVGRHLLVRFDTSTAQASLAVYDLDRGRWGAPVLDVNSLTIGGGAHGNQLYVARAGELVSYDLNTGSVRGTGFTDLGDGATRPLGWVRVPGWPGTTLVGTGSAGQMWQYNPLRREGRLIETTLTGQPVAIRSLAAGPDGKVYAGGFFTGGLATYDPATGESVGYTGIGQIEGMIAHNGRMYFGVYPHSRVFEYDPAQPWQPGVNPVKLFDLSAYEQSRPFAWTVAGELLAFGTVPQQGTVGGAVGLYEPRTGALTVLRDIVPGHSIIGLAYRDGVLYGSTSAWGGTSEPQGEAAVVFAYHLAQRRTLWQTAPVSGDLALGAIELAPDGRLWGLTPDALFEMDVETGTTLRYNRFSTYPWDTVDHIWLDTFLEFSADGRLYGKVQARTYQIDRDTMTPQLIVRPTSNMAMGPDGHLYLSRDNNFYTYRIC